MSTKGCICLLRPLLNMVNAGDEKPKMTVVILAQHPTSGLSSKERCALVQTSNLKLCPAKLHNLLEAWCLLVEF